MNELGIKICPICGNEYLEPSSISRKDNKTEICSRCGMQEAITTYLNENFKGNKKNDSLYCIFEKKLCRFAQNKNGVFNCTAPSDTALKLICK